MDLKAIKAEIEALYEEKRDKHEYSGDYRGGWDDCVERVLAKLDSHIEPKSEPKDKPYHRCPVCDGRGFVPFPGRIYTVGN